VEEAPDVSDTVLPTGGWCCCSGGEVVDPLIEQDGTVGLPRRCCRHGDPSVSVVPTTTEACVGALTVEVEAR